VAHQSVIALEPAQPLLQHQRHRRLLQIHQLPAASVMLALGGLLLFPDRAEEMVSQTFSISWTDVVH
jgi:hypothetical protein